MHIYDNRVMLDDPISKWLPEFSKDKLKILKSDIDGKIELESSKKDITISHLLTHTSGITYGIFGETYSDKFIKNEMGEKLTNEW